MVVLRVTGHIDLVDVGDEIAAPVHFPVDDLHGRLLIAGSPDILHPVDVRERQSILAHPPVIGVAGEAVGELGEAPFNEHKGACAHGILVPRPLPGVFHVLPDMLGDDIHLCHPGEDGDVHTVEDQLQGVVIHLDHIHKALLPDARPIQGGVLLAQVKREEDIIRAELHSIVPVDMVVEIER